MDDEQTGSKQLLEGSHKESTRVTGSASSNNDIVQAADNADGTVFPLDVNLESRGGASAEGAAGNTEKRNAEAGETISQPQIETDPLTSFEIPMTSSVHTRSKSIAYNSEHLQLLHHPPG